MAFPVDGTPVEGATPNPAYSGTTIPEIWSGKLLEKFYASTVLAAISNIDYEGEISAYGDKVKIRTKPTIAINNYVADGPLATQRPSAPNLELLIDQGKYFNTILDDVMAKQSDIDQISMWADDAGEQMKIVVDTDVLLGILGEADAANSGANAGKISGGIDLGVTTTPLLVSATTVIDTITNIGTCLDEQNIPESGRWIVIPAWMANRIKRSELRDASLTGDGYSVTRNGRLGMIDRFTIYMSNLLPTGAGAGLATGEFSVYAGHAHGLTFASQLTNVETIRSETHFGNKLRGLQVYGYKVLDPTALCEAIVVAA